MMKLIPTKSVLAFMLVTALIGCKTVNDGLETEKATSQKSAISKKNTANKSKDKNRQIEEVPEVLAMIAASKMTEARKGAARQSTTNATESHSASQQESSQSAPKVPIDSSVSEICSDWRSNRSNANTKWLHQTIAFSGQMTSMSNSTRYSEAGNMVMMDADKSVSLGVIFKNVRETLLFRTGQRISFTGKLTEIKSAPNNRCFFIVRNAVMTR